MKFLAGLFGIFFIFYFYYFNLTSLPAFYISSGSFFLLIFLLDDNERIGASANKSIYTKPYQERSYRCPVFLFFLFFIFEIVLIKIDIQVNTLGLDLRYMRELVGPLTYLSGNLGIQELASKKGN